MSKQMNTITHKFLKLVTDFTGTFNGAYNIRENGQCIGRQSSKNILIESKEDRPGLNITVLPGTKNETVYIPACVTKGGMNDHVFNDFFIGDNCNIKIVSGCGVHTDTNAAAQHSGVHHLVIGENSHVLYEEKHIGTGDGKGNHSINPVTELELKANSYLEINATQISGIDTTYRKTHATVAENARLIIHERLFTEKEQKAQTHLKVELNGNGSSADVISRSVARDKSYQSMDSVIVGNAICNGHSECDSLIDENAIVDASPRLLVRNKDAALIHEAAIGKIAGEQIQKLRTFGLTEEEAEDEIISGFLG